MKVSEKREFVKIISEMYINKIKKERQRVYSCLSKLIKERK